MNTPVYRIVIDGVTEWCGAGVEHSGEVFTSYKTTRPHSFIELWREPERIQDMPRREMYHDGHSPTV